MSTYKFHTPPPQPTFGALPEGDYPFIVAEVGDLYTNANANLILPVKINIQPGGEPVWANPWARTEASATQDGRDGIAEFLICINRQPKEGQEPDWRKVVGARGKCRLKTEIANQGALAGKEVNKIAWFHAPKQAEVGKPAMQSRPPAQQTQPGGGAPEPDDIPYSCDRI